MTPHEMGDYSEYWSAPAGRRCGDFFFLAEALSVLFPTFWMCWLSSALELNRCMRNDVDDMCNQYTACLVIPRALRHRKSRGFLDIGWCTNLSRVFLSAAHTRSSFRWRT